MGPMRNESLVQVVQRVIRIRHAEVGTRNAKRDGVHKFDGSKFGAVSQEEILSSIRNKNYDQ